MTKNAAGREMHIPPDAALGYFDALTVLLAYSSAPAAFETQVSGSPVSRIILSNLSVDIE